MYVETFEILMMIAFGTLTGTGIGLVLGFVAKKQKSEWSSMTREEHTINVVLAIVFCTICTAGLGFYYLL
jgi:hypothetical protein